MRSIGLLSLALAANCYAAAPTISSSSEGSTGTNATSSTISYPATIADDSLCMLGLAVDGLEGSLAATIGAEGFTLLKDGDQSSGASNGGVTGYVAYRYDIAAEAGTTFSITHSSEMTSFQMVCFDGAQPPATDAPEASTVAIGTTTGPDATAVTHTTGSADYGYWTYVGLDTANSAAVTTEPTGYSDGFNEVDSNQLAGSISAYAYKRTTGTTSDNPGAFTITGSAGEWFAFTVAIPPAPGGGGGGTVVNPITGIGGAAALPVN